MLVPLVFTRCSEYSARHRLPALRLAHAPTQVSEAQADELVQWEEAQRYPLAAEAVGVHVMARETQLREIVASCEGGRA